MVRLSYISRFMKVQLELYSLLHITVEWASDADAVIYYPAWYSIPTIIYTLLILTEKSITDISKKNWCYLLKNDI